MVISLLLKIVVVASVYSSWIDRCSIVVRLLRLVGTVVRSVVVVVRFFVQHFGIVVHYHMVFEQRSSYRSGLVVLHC